VNEIENWEVSDGPGRDRRTEEEHNRLPVYRYRTVVNGKWKAGGEGGKEKDGKRIKVQMED